MSVSRNAASVFNDRRRVLCLVALLLALGEIADAFFVSFPAGPAVYAALLLAATLWTRRGGLAGPILLATLFAFEIANAPFWPRHGAGDWISSVAYGVVALAGLLVATTVIKQSVNTRKTATRTVHAKA
jgi:hypothetical protein